MKLLIVGNNLSQGGIQTSLLNLLKEVANDNKYEIEVFLFAGNNDRISEIPSNVKVTRGNYLLKLTATSFAEVIKTKNIINIVVRIFLMILARILKPKRYFDFLFKFNKNNLQYDYAISYFNDIPNGYFNKGATYYVLNNVNAKKKVGWIHTDIKMACYDSQYYNREYKDFDYIINVSKHCKKVYDELIPSQKNKSFVIYNFFPIEEIKNKSLEKQDIIKKNQKYINFITVARIDNISKRIDRIIDVAKMLCERKLNNFRWYIIGDGPDFEKIKKIIQQYQLNNNIFLLGNKNNPYAYIRQSDLFILTSDFEGFPMVIGESLTIGTPVLVTNYDSAEEQIKNGYNGIIVKKDTNEIIKILQEILKNKEIIKRLKENVKKQNLDNAIAKKQFDKIFGEIRNE